MNQIVDDNERPKGIPIHSFLLDFDTEFQKKGISALKKFLESTTEKYNCTKWTILSDYAIGNKPNDVITFTIIPYIYDFDSLKMHIATLQPADLKSSRQVHQKFITFINNYPCFNISIILNKDRKIFNDEKKYFEEMIADNISMYECWIGNGQNDDKIEIYQKTIQMFKVLQRVLKQKNLQLKPLRDLEILSTLVAYLMFNIAKISPKAELIGWLSDRDILIDYKSEELGSILAFEYAESIYHILCVKYEIPECRILLINPAPKDKDNYDELLRIPDLLAGSLADYDFQQKKHSHPKFYSVCSGQAKADTLI